MQPQVGGTVTALAVNREEAARLLRAGSPGSAVSKGISTSNTHQDLGSNDPCVPSCGILLLSVLQPSLDLATKKNRSVCQQLLVIKHFKH